MKRFLTLSALSLWLTGAAAFSIACLSAGPVFAQRSASFAGRWTGYWENSLGEKGDDSLDLSEDRDGNLAGRIQRGVEIQAGPLKPFQPGVRDTATPTPEMRRADADGAASV